MKRTLILMFTIALLIAQNWGVAFASSSEHRLSVNEMLDLAESEIRQSVDRYVAQYMEQLRNSKDGGDATILGRTEPGGGTEEDVYLGQSQDLYSADSGDCGISSSAGFYSGASTYNLGSAQQAKAKGTSLGIGQGTHWAWIGEFFQVQGTGSQLCSINVPVSLYGDMSTVQGTAAVRTKLVIKDITENLEYTEIIEDYSIGSTGSKTFSGDSYSPTKDVYLRGGHSYIVYVYIATSVDCGLDWSSAKSDFYGTGLGIVYSRIRLIF